VVPDVDVGRFRLLASAIAGQPMDVAAGEAGELAWTDGATIFVDAEGRDGLRTSAVQASLVASGSLAPALMDKLARRPAPTRRYLALEGHRALAAMGDLLPASARRLVDRETASRSESAEQSLVLAAGRGAIPDPPEVFGAIRPKHVRTAVDATGDVPSSRHIPWRDEGTLQDHDPGEVDDDPPPLDFLASPVGGGGPIGRLLKRLLGDVRSGGSGAPGADAPTHRSRRSTRVARPSAVTTGAASVPADVELVARGSGVYPEWDVFRRRYRRDWCTVVERAVEPAPESAVRVPDADALRHALARLGMQLERRRRQPQGDDVDLDAAVEAYVESAAGSAPDEALYVDTVRSRRDLSVLVLLDISGSAGEPAATGGTVHEHQRAAAAGLVAALCDLGDRVALYAFRSQGRTAVEVLTVKHFDDAFDAAALRRLGSMVPRAYTRLGAAIRHGAAVLEAKGGTSRRLLVVFSDGFAYDHGYEGAYGEADARRALAEARRRGTACLCLSIAAATDPDALRRVFSTSAHARIPREDQLPGVVGPLFRSALRSVELRRRAWQRTYRTRGRLRLERRTA
jgi:nitric oxide reductase NorD protein